MDLIMDLKLILQLLHIITILQIRNGNCEKERVENNLKLKHPPLKLPDSLSISKDWAISFDEELGRNEDGVISKSKMLELERNLRKVASILHVTQHIKKPETPEDTTPAFPRYSLKGAKPTKSTPGEMILPLPSEPTFTLSIGVSTSKPRIIGHISNVQQRPQETLSTKLKPEPHNYLSSSSHSSSSSLPPLLKHYDRRHNQKLI